MRSFKAKEAVGPLPTVSQADLERLSENVVGAFPLPLSVVKMTVNGRERLVPLVTEEAGVVAGIAKALKFMRPAGFGSEMLSFPERSVATAQILFGKFPKGVLNREGRLKTKVRDEIVAYAKARHPFAKYGGDHCCIPFERRIDVPSSIDGRLHEIALQIGSAEAMGAKAVTALAETVGRWFADRYGAIFVTAIVTNAVTGRRVKVWTHWIGAITDSAQVARFNAIYNWAWKSQERAVTQTKGLLNGLHAAALPFGQDLRAIDAAAFGALIDSKDKVHTLFSATEQNVYGSVTLWVPCATVGGATQHPTAIACRKFAGIEHAADLARLIAAVGLASNFASLLQLSSPEGFSDTYRRLKR